MDNLLYGLALNLLLKLFFDKPAVDNPVPPPPEPAVTMNLGAKCSVNIPEWVTNIPGDCFVGISRPCESIAEARQRALDSAVSQILQAMGAEYFLKHSSSIKGNIHYSNHELDENLTYTAKWFVRSIQQEIKESNIQRINNKYRCFVLVHFSPSKIERMRKLTIGPKISARIVKIKKNQIVIEAREINDVEATLTEYQMRVISRNRHAGIKLLLLGTRSHIKIAIKGYDEIGRRTLSTFRSF